MWVLDGRRKTISVWCTLPHPHPHTHIHAGKKAGTVVMNWNNRPFRPIIFMCDVLDFIWAPLFCVYYELCLYRLCIVHTAIHTYGLIAHPCRKCSGKITFRNEKTMGHTHTHWLDIDVAQCVETSWITAHTGNYLGANVIIEVAIRSNEMNITAIFAKHYYFERNKNKHTFNRMIRANKNIYARLYTHSLIQFHFIYSAQLVRVNNSE